MSEGLRNTEGNTDTGRQTPRQRDGERDRGRQISCEGSGGQEGCLPCDLLAQPREDLTAPSFSQRFKLYSGFLKHLPGAHRQVYKNLQEVNAFIDHGVEKTHETLDPNAPPYFHPAPPRPHRLLPALLGYNGILERQWVVGGEEKKTRGEKGGERSRRIW